MRNRTSHSYFVVMQDYGHRGLEAVVRPEWTRRDIVAMIKSGELQDIAFIHAVDGLFIEDLTDEIVTEAKFEADLSDVQSTRILAEQDHKRDLRKHEAA